MISKILNSNCTTKNTWNPDLYLKAWNFATFAHEGQTYSGYKKNINIPYINHLSSVTMEVSLALVKSTKKYTADLAIQCALLHDVLEDTKCTYEDLVENFSADIADGVAALSKNKKLPSKLEQMLDSLQRIKLQPKEIWMVKLADRITNLYQPPLYWSKEKITNYCVSSNSRSTRKRRQGHIVSHKASQCF